MLAFSYEADRRGRCVDRILQGVVTMKCPVCGAAKLVHGTRDVPYTYKGETTSILGVTGDFCPACAELILDKEEGQRFGAMVRKFNKHVNAAFA